MLIVVGIAGIIVSGVLTNNFLKKAEVPGDLWGQMAGTGVVPKWVSFVNLSSWAVLAAGAVSFLV